MVIPYRDPKLRKKDLISEKKRLEKLLYYYVGSPDDDLILQRQIKFIDNELRILAETRKK